MLCLSLHLEVMVLEPAYLTVTCMNCSITVPPCASCIYKKQDEVQSAAVEVVLDVQFWQGLPGM